MKTFFKFPTDELDYTWDFTDWLDGDTINIFTFTIEPTGELVELPAKSGNDDSHVTGWFKDGTDKSVYQVACNITTIGGRIKTRSALFQMDSNL